MKRKRVSLYKPHIFIQHCNDLVLQNGHSVIDENASSGCRRDGSEAGPRFHRDPHHRERQDGLRPGRYRHQQVGKKPKFLALIILFIDAKPLYK